jgi:hypothetical protein
MLPASTAATLVLTAPCTVSGGVSNGGILFQAGAGFTGLCGVTLNLSRMGTDGQGNGIYSFQSVSYSFRAAPTPEPATLILFGSGLLGVVGARLRKRQ